MQTVNTIPGKTYAVECEGEVIITNTETGAIAAQVDGSGQVLFTACGNSYDVSDDTAKVVALFKLAPRLKLTLLQGVAGGWLPRGFTELEYLEASGTQYLLVDEPFTKGSGVYMDVHLTDSRLSQNGYYLYAYNLFFNSTYRLYAGLNGAARYIHNDEYGNYGSLLKAYSSDGRYSFWYNFRNSGEKVLTTSAGTYTQAITAGYVKSSSKFPMFGIWREHEKTSSVISASQRVYSLRMTQGAELTRDMVPVLNAAGAPGLWDKVNRVFIGNAGKGTFGYRIKRTGEAVAPMSLRDPWRVAPSGVWAKLKAENELDVVADTEMEDGEPLGYTWHANVGDAYDAYGIVIQEDFN